MKIITNIRTLLILALVALFSSNQNIAQNVGIGSESFTPDPSAMLEVKSTDKGMLVPRVNIEDLSTAAPVTNPAVSLLVYNNNETTGVGFYYWSGNEWVAIGGGGIQCNIPPTPLAGNSVVTYNKIIWNWIPGSDEPSFFKYNTVNNYGSATNLAGNNSLVMDNLNCEQTYTIYVWACNSCGCSSPITLTFTTSECPCGVQTVTFTYKGSPVTYGTVLGANNRCWLDRNLGATQVATGQADVNAYGDLFQWGRRDDGHQSRTSGVTSGTCDAVSTDTPPHSNFIKCNSGSWPNWRSPANNSLWEGVNGINNPCPNGWRVPSEGEWWTERNSWTSYNASGAFASPLKLPLAGMRMYDTGSLNGVGTAGRYWTAWVPNVVNSVAFEFDNSTGASQQRRAFGFSVRCIKD